MKKEQGEKHGGIINQVINQVGKINQRSQIQYVVPSHPVQKSSVNSVNGLRILFLLVLMVLSVSCQYISTPRESSIAIHSGSEGLIPLFVVNAPPSRMMEDSDSQVMIQVENRGAFSVQNAVYAIAGDSGFVSVQDPQGSIAVEGRSKLNPFPGKAMIETRLHSAVLDPQRQVHDATLTATVCYPYETRAALNVCIDTDPVNEVQRRKACTVGVVSGSGGQGGPVAVKEIEPSMVPEGDGVIPGFVIRIANSGSGLVVDPRKVSLACQTFAQGKELFDVVELNARLTDTPLVCDSKVKLEDGKAEVECVSSEPFSRALGSYTSPLTVNLRYGYTQSISTPVKIERRR